VGRWAMVAVESACVSLVACGGTTAPRLTQAQTDTFNDDRASLLVVVHKTDAGPKQWAVRCRSVLHPPDAPQRAALGRVLALATSRPNAVEVREFSEKDDVSVTDALNRTADDMALCRRRGAPIAAGWDDVEARLRAAATSG
jgi:hypothetical protein